MEVIEHVGIFIIGGLSCLLILAAIIYFKESRRETVRIPDMLNGQDALNIITQQLLGDNYYIVDPVSVKQGNAIVVQEILNRYSDKKIELGRVKNWEAMDDGIR